MILLHKSPTIGQPRVRIGAGPPAVKTGAAMSFSMFDNPTVTKITPSKWLFYTNRRPSANLEYRSAQKHRMSQSETYHILSAVLDYLTSRRPRIATTHGSGEKAIDLKNGQDNNNNKKKKNKKKPSVPCSIPSETFFYPVRPVIY